MRFAFWRKPDPSKLDTLSWNLMVAAIDPEQCWRIAGLLRDTDMPGSVRTCEVSFLMGSIVREIIRSAVPEKDQYSCITSAESAYYKTFDDQSTEPLPPEMANVYGSLTLGHVSRTALASYGEDQDLLLLTTAKLVQRLKGDPRMKYEIMPLFEERASFLRGLFSKAITS
ncbi:hypothetical protein ACOPJQ_05090 [Luteimonas dalianensis]|uniref:hypothetical protein n=1 Tax=Luteimonas dalianensis TaxID=1148196 RepID=UPI003BEFC0B8